MPPKEYSFDDFNYLDENGDEEMEAYEIGDTAERRDYVAEVRHDERERTVRVMQRNAELQHELRESVSAMEIMLESQERIERIQRSLAYLRGLRDRMLAAGVGDEDDDEEDDDDEDEVEMSRTVGDSDAFSSRSSSTQSSALPTPSHSRTTSSSSSDGNSLISDIEDLADQMT